KAERCDKDSDVNITTVYCSYDADTLGKNPADGRKVKGVIHWVEATTAKPAEFRLYQRLFTDPNPAAAETVDEVLNPNSLEVVNGLVEASLVNAPAEKAYQFEREGYFCADNKDSSAEHLVFNLTVALRDSFE
ncbi:MAG: glutamine--tRNA ligase, partial [Shewanella sp.]